jgi:hypothetical protein
LLIEPGSVAELRILNAGQKRTISGYFNDVVKMAAVAEHWSGRVPAVYFTLNPVLPDLLARASNRVIEHARATTTDNNIVKRIWLPTDFDVTRPAGISSTEEEHTDALERAIACRAFLREQRWPDPIYADSGNGAHLLHRVDLPTDSTLIKRVLEALAARFDNGRVHVDTAMFNPARIWKLYGTLVCKGDNVPARPHRLSKILEAPAELAIVTTAQLEALAGLESPPPPPAAANTPVKSERPYEVRTHRAFDLEAWLEKHADRLPPLGIKREWPTNGSGIGWKREFEYCPWNSDHTNNSAFVGCLGSGAPVAKCQHHSCQGKNWNDLKAVVGDSETGQWNPPAKNTTAAVMPAVADSIRQFDQIPDIMTMKIPAIEYLVDGLIARGTITLWTGSDGTAKTFLVQSMSIAVATGKTFLGRQCQIAPVLYLDYENPSFAVRERLDVMAGGPVAGLKVWGTWLEQQPPQLGNELLLSIAKETKPLIIIDPFRYAHGAEENDSTEMMAVMQMLRYCAAAGGAVVILHHPAKTEGSTGRGSTAIKGAADVAFLQELSDESGLITLKCTKNRFGERMTVTIKPDYDEGKFEVTDSEAFTRRSTEAEKLLEIITANPGLSQNSWWKESGMKKTRFLALVKDNVGRLWREEKSGSAKLYFSTCSLDREQQGTRGTGQEGDELFPCSLVLGGNREQLGPDPNNCSGNRWEQVTQKQGEETAEISVGELEL